MEWTWTKTKTRGRKETRIQGLKGFSNFDLGVLNLDLNLRLRGCKIGIGKKRFVVVVEWISMGVRF